MTYKSIGMIILCEKPHICNAILNAGWFDWTSLSYNKLPHGKDMNHQQHAIVSLQYSASVGL